MNKYIRLVNPVVCTVVGSATQITVPSNAKLSITGSTTAATTATALSSAALASSSASQIALIHNPAELEGVCIRLPMNYVAKADGVAGKEPTQELTNEQRVKREQYKASIAAVLAKILDWEKLPAVDAQSFAHGIRDMGLVTDFVSDIIALSKSRLRAWIHHINMQIPSPSLTVELASFPDKSKHLVLVLSSAW